MWQIEDLFSINRNDIHVLIKQIRQPSSNRSRIKSSSISLNLVLLNVRTCCEQLIVPNFIVSFFLSYWEKRSTIELLPPWFTTEAYNLFTWSFNFSKKISPSPRHFCPWNELSLFEIRAFRIRMRQRNVIICEFVVRDTEILRHVNHNICERSLDHLNYVNRKTCRNVSFIPLPLLSAYRMSIFDLTSLQN